MTTRELTEMVQQQTVAREALYLRALKARNVPHAERRAAEMACMNRRERRRYDREVRKAVSR